MSEMRHRIYEDEFEQVFIGLLLRLKQLLESEEDQESAEIVLRFLNRLYTTRRGRPSYPEFTWSHARTMHKLYSEFVSKYYRTEKEESEKS
jgi:hypothetical protein